MEDLNFLDDELWNKIWDCITLSFVDRKRFENHEASWRHPSVTPQQAHLSQSGTPVEPSHHRIRNRKRRQNKRSTMGMTLAIHMHSIHQINQRKLRGKILQEADPMSPTASTLRCQFKERYRYMTSRIMATRYMASKSKQAMPRSIVQSQERIGPSILGKNLTLHWKNTARQTVNGRIMLTLPPLPMFDQETLLVALDRERLCSRAQYIIQMHRESIPCLV